MDDYQKIKLDGSDCIIQPDRMTITPTLRKGTKIIVDRLTQEIVSQDFFFGITVSTKRRIPFDDVIRVVGKHLQSQNILPLFRKFQPPPHFYQIFLTTRQGHTYAFARIIERSNADSRASTKGKILVQKLRKWVGLPEESDSVWD